MKAFVRTPVAVAASITAAIFVAAGGAFAASTSPAPTASALFSFADPAIAESSGLASSAYDEDVFTHNDSGDSARFFKVDREGKTVAVYTLRGATNVDWEDMATGTDVSGKPVLYFGDIGDNTGTRKEIDVYEVPEPDGPSGDVSWVRYRFSYPDGAHDAEALLVDPRSHQIFVATKSLLGGELYAAPVNPVETAVNVLTPVRTVPPLVTSGDFSPDGSRIVLLTYLNAYWAIGVRGQLHAFAVPLQRQNEAIAVVSDGSAVIVGSEGLHSSVYEIPLPALSPPPSGPGASGRSQPQSRSPQQLSPRSAPSSAGAQSISLRPGAGDVKHERFPWFAVFIPVALALIGVGWAAVHRWRRSRRGSHIG